MTTMRSRATAALLGLCALLGPTPSARAAMTFRPIGPLGGDVRSLAQDPTDPRRVYAGTVDGMLYVSLNAGASWARLEPGFPLRGVSLDDLMVTDTGEVLASFWKIDGTGGGIGLSLDRGATFFMIGAGLEGEAVRGLARAPSNPKVFVAVTRTGVFKSTDEAEHFTRISPPDHPGLRMVGSVVIDPRNENSILVGTAHLAWRTDNGGRTWRPIQQGMVNDSDVMTLTLDRRDPATVFATACTGVWRSRNAGSSWRKVLGIPSVSRRTRAFAQDGNRPDIFYAGTTDGVYVSDDDAATFARTSSPGLVVNALVSLGGGRVLAGVEGEGVLVSTDFGGSWQSSNDGLRERLVRRIVRDESRDRLFALTAADGSRNSALFEMDRAREAWRRIELPDHREIQTLGFLDNGDLILGTDDGAFRGTRAGPPWNRLSLTVSGVDAHARVTRIHTRGSQLLVASDQGLFVSPDHGSSWRRLLFGASPVIVGLAVASTGRVIVATPLAIYRAEADLVFRPAASVGFRGLQSLEFAPGSDSKVFAATSFGLFASRDAGEKWFQVSTTLSRVSALAQHEDGQVLFAADAGALFRSDDGGQTFWPLVARGLASQNAFSLAIEKPRAPEGRPVLIVAASGGGVLEGEIEASRLTGEKRR